jgi:hypothetical protein
MAGPEIPALQGFDAFMSLPAPERQALKSDPEKARRWSLTWVTKFAAALPGDVRGAAVALIVEAIASSQ